MVDKEIEDLKLECAIYRHRLSEEIDRGIRLQKELELKARQLEEYENSDKSHKK